MRSHSYLERTHLSLPETCVLNHSCAQATVAEEAAVEAVFNASNGVGGRRRAWRDDNSESKVCQR